MVKWFIWFGLGQLRSPFLNKELLTNRKNKSVLNIICHFLFKVIFTQVSTILIIFFYGLLGFNLVSLDITFVIILTFMMYYKFVTVLIFTEATSYMNICFYILTYIIHHNINFHKRSFVHEYSYLFLGNFCKPIFTCLLNYR